MALNKPATSLASYGYSLKAAGHRLSVSELSGRTVNYAYDSLYRLTSETIASDPNQINGAVNYTYDSVGNRKTIASTCAPDYSTVSVLVTDTGTVPPAGVSVTVTKYELAVVGAASSARQAKQNAPIGHGSTVIVSVDSNSGSNTVQYLNR